MVKIDEHIVECILQLQNPAIVGVSGFGGAGKSTVATCISEQTGIPVVGVDSFMKSSTNTHYSNWDIVDFARIEREVFQPFLKGENSIRYGHFDWDKNNITETKEVAHNGYIIVEGVGLFRPNLMQYFAYTIWVDCPTEEAIARGKKRDRDVHHNPQEESWDGVWKQNDEQYLQNFHPKEMVDIIISN
jgi:uridine kinase